MNKKYQINKEELKSKSCQLSAKQGFTLIETLIAIAILMLAIVGPLTISSNSLNTAYYARDQVTAFYLAQEGVEYMRELRDNNSIATNVSNGGIWDDGLTYCQDVLCGLDPLPPAGPSRLFVCVSIDECPVKYDPATGLYRQQINSSPTFENTNFKRYITLKHVSDNEDKVTVVVFWTTGNLKSPNNFKVTESIFNWQQ